MNRTFMLGYYQGVIEAAPATLSAEKTEEFAVAMTIQHLHHAGKDSVAINNFLVQDAHANPRIISKFITLNADQLETVQAEIIKMAY